MKQFLLTSVATIAISIGTVATAQSEQRVAYMRCVDEHVDNVTLLVLSLHEGAALIRETLCTFQAFDYALSLTSNVPHYMEEADNNFNAAIQAAYSYIEKGTRAAMYYRLLEISEGP